MERDIDKRYAATRTTTAGKSYSKAFATREEANLWVARYGKCKNYDGASIIDMEKGRVLWDSTTGEHGLVVERDGDPARVAAERDWNSGKPCRATFKAFVAVDGVTRAAYFKSLESARLWVAGHVATRGGGYSDVRILRKAGASDLEEEFPGYALRFFDDGKVAATRAFDGKTEADNALYALMYGGEAATFDAEHAQLIKLNEGCVIYGCRVSLRVADDGGDADPGEDMTDGLSAAMIAAAIPAEVSAAGAVDVNADSSRDGYGPCTAEEAAAELAERADEREALRENAYWLIAEHGQAVWLYRAESGAPEVELGGECAWSEDAELDDDPEVPPESEYAAELNDAIHGKATGTLAQVAESVRAAAERDAAERDARGDLWPRCTYAAFWSFGGAWHGCLLEDGVAESGDNINDEIAEVDPKAVIVSADGLRAHMAGDIAEAVRASHVAPRARATARRAG